MHDIFLRKIIISVGGVSFLNFLTYFFNTLFHIANKTSTNKVEGLLDNSYNC